MCQRHGESFGDRGWPSSTPAPGQMPFLERQESSTLQACCRLKQSPFMLSSAVVLTSGPGRQRHRVTLCCPKPCACALQRDACKCVLLPAGEPISTRWTKGIMQEIKRSRIETTRKLVVGVIAASKPAGLFDPACSLSHSCQIATASLKL